MSCFIPGKFFTALNSNIRLHVKTNISAHCADAPHIFTAKVYVKIVGSLQGGQLSGIVGAQ